MKIYVASSWRNPHQPEVVQALQAAGHDVYDFRHPAVNNDGFHWTEIDPDWQDWSVEQYLEALSHPVAESGFKFDMDAMVWADALVLVMPCGRSAHLECGWFVGEGKATVILHRADEPCEPELMTKMCDHQVDNIEDALTYLEGLGE